MRAAASSLGAHVFLSLRTLLPFHSVVVPLCGLSPFASFALHVNSFRGARFNINSSRFRFFPPLPWFSSYHLLHSHQLG